MANTQPGEAERNNPLRPVIWGGAAGLLLLPLVAMQFTAEVDWDLADFVVFGVMLLLACGAYEFAARLTSNQTYRLATGLALLGGFLLAWVIGAVGVLGADGENADLMYAGVFATGLVGAVISRFKPSGMSRTLFAMAVVQALIAGAALAMGMHEAPHSSAGEILGLNAIWVALFLGSAWLFRQSARQQAR